jgi:hypothetical protein
MLDFIFGFALTLIVAAAIASLVFTHKDLNK